MSQEESFRFGCHRSSKKHKHHRVPQRGISVAQLEKIRLEEQQKSLPNSHSFPAINHHTPPHSTSVSYKSSQDPVFTIPDLLQPFSSSETPANPPLLPRFWSHHDTFLANVENFGLPLPALYDSNASTEQNTLVSVSPTSSSGVHLQTEPPSNQIYTKNEFTPAAQGRQESNGGSTNRDSVCNSRFDGERTVSGSDDHLRPQQVRRHFYPHLLHQAGGQFYRFLRPEPSSRKSEVKDRRDSVQTERKASIDLNLKL